MSAPSTERHAAVFVLIIVLGPFLWFGYAGVIRPWRMTNAFLDEIVRVMRRGRCPRFLLRTWQFQFADIHTYLRALITMVP